MQSSISTEVMLVNRDVVPFLVASKRRGIELRNCPGFLQEWIRRLNSPTLVYLLEV